MKAFSLLKIGVLCGLLCILLGTSRTVEGQVSLTPENAPEFVGSVEEWINSKPLNIKQLRGKVILIDLGAFRFI